MQKIIGTYTSAVIYSDTAEEYAKAQVKMICDQPAAEGSKVRLMPDIHPGHIGPVGLTMTIKDKVMPGLIGTDIGCGVSYIKIKKTNVEYQKLDKVIKEKIPVGSRIRKEPHRLSDDFDFDDLVCRKYIGVKKAALSLGTLGGGNHFIEIDVDTEGDQYLVVHSGSRHLGKEVAEYYLKRGQEELKKKGMDIPYEMTYLEGQLLEDYLKDVITVQGYAMLSREIILREIAKAMKWKIISYGECIHNYIDESKILRKGAVAAYEGDEVIIPINMRDGIVLGKGKGNPEWNHSAPHGAGRILSRSDVKNHHTVSEFKKEMKGIHCTTVGADTLDEAPFAYRGIDEIQEAIRDTVDIVKVLKPVYNYKAGERR